MEGKNVKYLETVDDFINVDAAFADVVFVKDKERTGGNAFVNKKGLTKNDGTIYEGFDGTFWEMQYSGSINILWFGAKGDHIPYQSNESVGLDNSEIFNRVIANLKPDEELFIPTGNYYFTKTLMIKGGVKNIKCLGNLSFKKGIDGIYIDGGNGVYVHNIEFAGYLYGDNAGCFDDYNNTAVRIVNSWNGTFKFYRMQQWRIAVHLDTDINGDGKETYRGSQYNKISWDHFLNVNTGIKISCTSPVSSWNNENFFYGGRLSGKNGVVFKRSGQQEVVNKGQEDETIIQQDIFNGNKFYNVAIEGIEEVGFKLDYAANNLFVGSRISKPENSRCTEPLNEKGECPVGKTEYATLIDLSESTEYNTFLGMSLYEDKIKDKGKANSFIGGNTFTTNGCPLGPIRLGTREKGPLYIGALTDESESDQILLLKTEKPQSYFATAKSNKAILNVPYEETYQFINNEGEVDLKRNIGWVRVTLYKDHGVVRLKLANEDIGGSAKDHNKFIIDIASANTSVELLNEAGDVLIPASEMNSFGVYQILCSQSDFRCVKISGITGDKVVEIKEGTTASEYFYPTVKAGADNIDLVGHYSEPRFDDNKKKGLRKWSWKFGFPAWISSNREKKPALLQIQPEANTTAAIINVRSNFGYNIDTTTYAQFIGTGSENKDWGNAPSAVWKWKTGTANKNDAKLILSSAIWSDYNDKFGIEPSSTPDLFEFGMDGQLKLHINPPKGNSLDSILVRSSDGVIKAIPFKELVEAIKKA